jgi:hypothetical protein
MINKYLLIEILNFLSINDIIKYSLIDKESYNFVLNNKFIINKYNYIKNIILGIQNNYNSKVEWLLKQNTNQFIDKRLFLCLTLISSNNYYFIDFFTKNNQYNLLKKNKEKYILLLRENHITNTLTPNKILNIIKEKFQFDKTLVKLLFNIFYIKKYKYFYKKYYEYNDEILHFLCNLT